MTDHRRELFDRVSKHLIAQGGPAIDAMGRCRLRTDGGLSCAVGCLITDEHYKSELESYAITGGDMLLRHVEMSLGYTLTFEEVSLLDELRMVHDDWDCNNNCNNTGWVHSQLYRIERSIT